MGILGVRPTGSNLSGVARIKVLRARDVIRVKETHADVLSWASMNVHVLLPHAIRQKSGVVPEVIYTAPTVANFSEELVEGEQGLMYRQVLTTFLPDDSASVRWVMNQDGEEKYLVVFEDNNGAVRLMGSKKQPALKKVGFGTGNKGYEIRFEAMSVGLCWFLPGWADSLILSEL
jgi:hypothetical protein